MILYQNKCFNEFKSFSINLIKEQTQVSISKIRKSIKIFKELNYISEGAVNHSAKTYYVTETGINKIKELI
jgi:DNA-binding transcriptional regulator GbsR (MarR family)